MFTNVNRSRILLISAFLFVFAMAVVFNRPVSASATGQTGVIDNSCLTCHEDLYYLHDTGSMYCITDHADSCVNCHEGNPAAVKKDEAHLGLIFHPQENNGAKCKECHAEQDAQSRLTQFAAVDKFDAVIKPEDYTPNQAAALGLQQEEKTNPIIANWMWITGALVMFGLWLALILFSPMKP